MPGSKTYTSYKANELLEFELLNAIQSMNKKRSSSFRFTLFWEVVKISISVVFASLFSPYIDGKSLSEQWNFLGTLVLLFLLSYLAVSGLLVVAKWLFDALFNKRRLRKEQVYANDYFHKRILNYVYLAIGFENKFNCYLQKYSCCSNNCSEVDLIVTYLAQAVYYFEKANTELKKIIPPKEMEKNIKKEKVNAEYLSIIGYDYLITSIEGSINSIKRISGAAKELEVNHPLLFKCIFDQKYQDNVSALALTANMLILSYEQYYERVYALREKSDGKK